MALEMTITKSYRGRPILAVNEVSHMQPYIDDTAFSFAPVTVSK